jgi:GntR family transcriptional regulator
MLIVVDPHSGVPVYRQLMDQIRFHISSGLLAPGDELPSTRALSAELGINPMTISKAYSYLERDGVVERRPGRPLRVKAVDDDDARARRIDQLKETLQSGVTVARQLGIENSEAIRVFTEMLGDGTDRENES